jgi:hypothetical protein
MDPITTIGTLLTSVKTATDIAAAIKQSATSLAEAETKFKLAELIGALADTKLHIADIQQLLLAKDDEIRDLRQKLELKEKVKWVRPFYWVEDGDGRDGPFCPQCYDSEHKLIRLQRWDSSHWHCNTCNSDFTGDSAGIVY